MAIYTLHEYAFINTDPKEVASATDKPYETNSKGTTIIDVNKDLTYSRSLISLHTTKSTQDKFNQIIDIEFQDFIKPVSNSPAIFLENQISALQSNNTTLAGARDKLIKDNEGLKRINDRLKDELEREPRKLINAVSDTMFVGGVLYSNRPGEDRLLSEDKTHIAVIQQDGNFVIYKSLYDEFGNQIVDAPFTAVVFDTGENEYDFQSPAIFKLDQTNGLQIARRTGFGRINSAPSPVPANSIKSTGKVVLDNNGILNLYSDSTTILWSSFVNTFTERSETVTNSGNPLYSVEGLKDASYATQTAANNATNAQQAAADAQGLTLEVYQYAIANGSSVLINVLDLKRVNGFTKSEFRSMMTSIIGITGDAADDVWKAGTAYDATSVISHNTARAKAAALYNEITSNSTSTVDGAIIKIKINRTPYKFIL
jgi:hypothetical protein